MPHEPVTVCPRVTRAKMTSLCKSFHSRQTYIKYSRVGSIAVAQKFCSRWMMYVN